MTIKSALFLTASIVAVLIAAMLPGCIPDPNNPINSNIKVYSGTGKGESQQQSQPPPTPVQSAPPSTQVTERHIVITDANSVFSVGVPGHYREERTVTAEKPINFWFEYIDPSVTLTVDGVTLTIPGRRTSEKLGYQPSVNKFSYTLYNPTDNATSYNLHMVPAKSGDSVPAVTQEKWTIP